MSLFSFFRRNNSFSLKDFVRQYGFETTVNAFATIIMNKFSDDINVKLAEMNQFLREEADAMSQGDAYPRSVARRLFEHPSEYRGAMLETSEYPIDQPGGPQQTLLAMTLRFMKEDVDLAVRFRCSVVERVKVGLYIFTLSDAIVGADAIIAKEFPNLDRELKESYRMLEMLMEKHPEEMRKYI